MANTLKLNHEKGQIVMDRAFAKNAENTMSNEYAHLQNVRRDYPTYTVVRHTIKKNTNKETYKGLTYEFMEYYISKYEPEVSRKTVQKELEDMIEISKCHAKGRRYPTIKKWFLEKYPVVAEFGMNEKELAAYHKAQEKKAQEEKSQPEAEEKKDNVIPMPQQQEDESQQDVDDIGA